MAVRDPYIIHQQLNESEIEVTIRTRGIVPHSSKPDNQKAENGTVEVKFFNQGFDAIAEVEEVKKPNTIWKFKVIRLPSPIDQSACQFRVIKDNVIIILKKQLGVDGRYMDWKAILHEKGIDQYDSSEDEDGNMPAPATFKQRLESLDLPFEVQYGKDNVFEYDNN